ncbi:MAG: two-component system sensor histidine kinase/response regulator, partial [Candidatus Latescibacterota bacterium]
MDLKTKSAQILIVDDMPQNIQILEELLHRENFKLHSVNDGSQVLEFVQTQKIDLILLDIRMPNQNGFDTCRQLKAHSNTEEIPIIMITASNKKEDIIKSFEAGAVDYVTYPFESTELLSRVRSHLRNHFLYEELKHHIDENTRLKREHERFLRHEIKNLLTPIQGYAEILRYKNSLDKTDTEYVGYIYEGTQKFLDFIDKLKQLQDLENGDVQTQNETFDLIPTLKKITEDLQTNTTTSKLDLPNELMIVADHELLQKALHHLIKNAYEHVQNLDDLKQKNITITTHQTDHTLQIEINNRGPELPPEDCQTFFQKFNSKNKSEAVGLGTTYAYWITKIHNGDISVSSNKQNGTTVTITLP